MEAEKEKRSAKFPIAAACVVVTLLLILTTTTIYSLLKCSQLETRLEKLEFFIESRIRASVSGEDRSETESAELTRIRRDATDQLGNLSLHELLSLRGRDGRDGRDGKDGDDGKDGEDGDDGVDGRNGVNGIDGQNCDCSTLLRSSTAASVVRSGVERNSSLTDQLSNIRSSLNELQSQVESSGRSSNTNTVQGGSTYIRWGRTSCGNNSQLLYQGFAAGSHYTQEGGSAEYTCLTLDPEFNQWTTADSGGWIYGAEYQSHSVGIFPNEAHDKNVPCARCYVPRRSETIMIPAKRTCPDTWNKEYEGYLMSGHYNHKHPYNYACVDASPEYLAGTHANTDGALFYFVQSHCPSTFHCPPYIESGELTCVVCSK